MDDDFISALNHAVKEEIVQGFFRERCILQEETAEFNELVAKLDRERLGLDQALAKLRGVLALPEQWDDFWSLALSGAGAPPQAEGPAEFPAGPDCRGWTWSRRYVNLVKSTARSLWSTADLVRRLKDNLDALAEEVNGDIKKFETNFDVLAITAFLRGMDVETMAKRYDLASCLDGQACLALDDSLRFRRLKPPEWGELAWTADLGPEKAFVDAAGQTARRWAKRQAKAVKEMLIRQPGPLG